MGASFHGVAKAAVAGGNFHDPHRERHGGCILSGDVHEIASQYPVGIQAQVVVGLTLFWSFGNRTDAGGHVEDRHQRRFVAEAIPQTLLLRSDTLVPVDIETNHVDSTSIQTVERFTKQSVVNGPSKPLDVGFFNADQGDGGVSTGLRRSLMRDQVIDH